MAAGELGEADDGSRTGLVENTLVEHGTITSGVQTKIKVGVMEMRGSSLEEHTESITSLLEGLLGDLCGITFTDLAGTAVDGRDAVSTDFEVENFGYHVRTSS